LYGILWSVANRIFGWDFGEGAGPDLPQGWEAVVLSLCTTLPLTIVPGAFEFITRKQIVLPSHYRASALMIVAAAIGHVLLYGTRGPRIRGLRDRVFPSGSPLDPWAAVRMEAIYAVVHFVSTIFAYQVGLEIEDLTISKLVAAVEKT
jgi:hypothetical protein